MSRLVFRLPYLFLVLVPLILFSPIYLAGKALFWGTPLMQFIPWWSWAWHILKAGQIPLWNPWLGMGTPLIANYQSGLFYPPNWLFFILAALGGVPWMAWGLALQVALHLAWSGIGMAMLAKRLGVAVLGQVVSGIAFGLSDYLVSRAGFLSINAAVAWLPWIILGVTSVIDRWIKDRGTGVLTSLTPKPHSLVSFTERVGSVILLSIVLAMQLLAGHAQITWYSWLLAGMWVIYRLWASDARGWRRLIWPVGALLTAILLGIALASVQIFPTAEYLLQSQRASEVGYKFATTYSFWPWRFMTLLAPGLFGNPASGDYWGYGNYWEDAVYIGLLPFVLAISMIGSSFKREKWIMARGEKQLNKNHGQSLVYFLIIVILISFTLALGKNTPVFPWLYRYVPTFDMFQAPTRISIWAVFAMALLAGIGTDRWRRPKGRGLYWSRLGTMGAAAVAAGAGITAWVFQRSLGEINPSAIKATALAGFWGLGLGLLTLTAPLADGERPRELRIGWWGWAVVFWVAADLLVAGWGLNPSAPLEIFRNPSPSAREIRAIAGEGRLYLSSDDEKELKFKRFFRFDSFDPFEGADDWQQLRATLLPNTSMLDDIPSANNYDPLVPGRYANWVQTLEEGDAAKKADLLNLMSVSVVERVDSTQPNGVRFDARETRPRLRWSSCGRVSSSGEQALEAVLGGASNPSSPVILELKDDPQAPLCHGDAQAVLSIISDSGNRLVVRAISSTSGYLILADVWYPGWIAEVDGSLEPILHADYLFRAVRLSKGEHEVIIVYRPVWFYLGAGLSGVAWLSLGILGILKIRSIQKHSSTKGEY